MKLRYLALGLFFVLLAGCGPAPTAPVASTATLLSTLAPSPPATAVPPTATLPASATPSPTASPLPSPSSTPSATFTPAPTPTPFGGGMPIMAGFGGTGQGAKFLYFGALGSLIPVATANASKEYPVGVLGYSPLSWTSDGRKLLFLNGTGDGIAMSLFELDTQAGTTTEIIRLPQAELTDLAWAPGDNPQYAVFWAFDSSSDTIWVVDVAAKSAKRIGSGYAPRWTADGSAIIYSPKTGGWTQVDPKTGARVDLVLPKKSKKFSATASKSITYGCCSDYITQLDSWLMTQLNADGSWSYILVSRKDSSQELLAQSTQGVHFQVRQVLLSPDGSRLLVTLSVDPKGHLVLYNIRTADLPISVADSTDDTRHYGGSWSPDSKSYLAWSNNSPAIYDAQSNAEIGAVFPLPNAQTWLTSPYGAGGVSVIWPSRPVVIAASFSTVAAALKPSISNVPTYDDFSENSLDPNRWNVPTLPAGISEQVVSGTLEFSSQSPAQGAQVGLDLRTQRPAAQPVAFESRLRVDRQTTGTGGVIYMLLSANLPQASWQAECHLFTDGQFSCFVYQWQNGQYVPEYSSNSVDALPGQPYLFRIEWDPASAWLKFYRDGQLFDAYKPKDAQALLGLALQPSVGIRVNPGATFVANIDDVRLSP